MNTDPIADMLTRIRNAYLAKKPEVVLPYSKFKESLGNLLVTQGWLSAMAAAELEGRKLLKLALKYENGEGVIAGMNRVSRPGQRIYASSAGIRKVTGTLGMAIVSTSRGLMTDRQARKEKIGGEIICQIW